MLSARLPYKPSHLWCEGTQRHARYPGAGASSLGSFLTAKSVKCSLQSHRVSIPTTALWIVLGPEAAVPKLGCLPAVQGRPRGRGTTEPRPGSHLPCVLLPKANPPACATGSGSPPLPSPPAHLLPPEVLQASRTSPSRCRTEGQQRG